MPVIAAETGMVLVLVVLIAIPIGAFVFARGAGGALREIGRGEFAIDPDEPAGAGSGAPATAGAVREDEIRQLVQARSYRRERRGEQALDVEAEVRRLLGSVDADAGRPADPALREEVRQLVVARNERRQRRGEQPLEVEAEVERRLRELESLGQ